MTTLSISKKERLRSLPHEKRSEQKDMRKEKKKYQHSPREPLPSPPPVQIDSEMTCWLDICNVPGASCSSQEAQSGSSLQFDPTRKTILTASLALISKADSRRICLSVVDRHVSHVQGIAKDNVDREAQRHETDAS